MIDQWIELNGRCTNISPNLAVFGCIWAYAFDGRLFDGFLPVLTDGYLELPGQHLQQNLQ